MQNFNHATCYDQQTHCSGNAMKTYELFSRRQKRLRGEVPEVYVYDVIPDALRVQIVHIMRDVLGVPGYTISDSPRELYKSIIEILCREFGVFHLTGTSAFDNAHSHQSLFKFILEEEDVEMVLDAVELSCLAVDTETRSYSYLRREDFDEAATEAIKEVNYRFQSHGVGYRYESTKIVRIDSEMVHAEVVKPALALLHDKQFAGAEEEFLNAFEHHRHLRHKEALTDCLKALESTLKSIAQNRGWTAPANATAKALLDLMFEQQLIPQFWSQHFGGLRAMLEAGVPTVRNRLGSHGQGKDPIEVPASIAGYAIHQTAAAIVFLVRANNERSESSR